MGFILETFGHNFCDFIKKSDTILNSEVIFQYVIVVHPICRGDKWTYRLQNK